MAQFAESIRQPVNCENGLILISKLNLFKVHEGELNLT